MACLCYFDFGLGSWLLSCFIQSKGGKVAEKVDIYKLKKGDLIRVFKADQDVFVGRVTEIRAVDSDPDYIFFENGTPLAVSILKKINAEVITVDELVETFTQAHQSHIAINKLLKETINKIERMTGISMHAGGWEGLHESPAHLSSFEKMIGTSEGLNDY